MTISFLEWKQQKTQHVRTQVKVKRTEKCDANQSSDN